MIRSFLITCIKTYCRHIPIHIGKGILMRIGRKILLNGKKQEILKADSIHGVSMEVVLPRDAGWDG